MTTKIYVSNDKHICFDDLEDKDFMRIRKIDKTTGGTLITFNDYDSAYRSAKVFMNKGFETVRILTKT